MGYTALETVAEDFSSGQPSDYSRIEKYIASVFNDLYFEGINSNGNIVNSMGWFYDSIIEICGSENGINPYNCYLDGSCPNEEDCYASVDSSSCPWDMCREDLADYFVYTFPIYKFYLLISVSGMVAFMFIACMLICYNPAKRPNILPRGTRATLDQKNFSSNPLPRAHGEANVHTQTRSKRKMKKSSSSGTSGNGQVTMKVPRGFEKLSKQEQVTYLRRLKQLKEEGGGTASTVPPVNPPTPKNSQESYLGQRYQSNQKQPQQMLFL